MEPFHEYLDEYRKQMKLGAINKAYKGLLEYFMDLRTHFYKRYPDYYVSGSIYFGYMDMTYFSFFPQSFKDRNLKIAIVFLHEAFRFEVWLAGVNKQAQQKYWELIKESGWDQYHLVPTTKGADAIIEGILVADPDFRDLDKLTEQIEAATLLFIKDVEGFLSGVEGHV